MVNKKTGEAIQESVITLDFDLKNLRGKKYKIWEYNIVFQNPHPEYQTILYQQNMKIGCN